MQRLGDPIEVDADDSTNIDLEDGESLRVEQINEDDTATGTFQKLP
jgi:hypothetical protein